MVDLHTCPINNQLNPWDFQGPPIMGPPYGKRDPYYSHTTPIRIPKDMGVPGITLD